MFAKIKPNAGSQVDRHTGCPGKSRDMLVMGIWQKYGGWYIGIAIGMAALTQVDGVFCINYDRSPTDERSILLLLISSCSLYRHDCMLVCGCCCRNRTSVLGNKLGTIRKLSSIIRKTHGQITLFIRSTLLAQWHASLIRFQDIGQLPRDPSQITGAAGYRIIHQRDQLTGNMHCNDCWRAQLSSSWIPVGRYRIKNWPPMFLGTMKRGNSKVASKMSIWSHVTHMGSQVVPPSLTERVPCIAEWHCLGRNTLTSFGSLSWEYLTSLR